MKKKSFLFIVILLFTTSLYAQHDIKANFFGLGFNNYGMGYEYIINDEMAAGIFIDYSENSIYSNLITYGIDGDPFSTEGYQYYRFCISPEFRFYSSPDYGADKRFFSFYARYKNTVYNDISFYEPNNEIKYGTINKQFGIGVATGQKWITNSGIYFETYLGIGRMIVSNLVYDNTYVENELNNGSYEHVYESFWDVRFHLSVGYRIGGY